MAVWTLILLEDVEYVYPAVRVKYDTTLAENRGRIRNLKRRLYSRSWC